jgi:hypothetical protein
MEIKKPLGRPHKVTYRTVIRLADAIQHNATITDACDFVGISPQTYYFYFNNNQVFAKTITRAKDNQDKLTMSFLATY